MQLNGKVALVTGGGRRVGRAVTLALAEAGCDCLFTYRRSGEEAASLIGEIEAKGRRAEALEVDLEAEDAASTVDGAVRSSFGRLDVLVHNASIFEASAWGEVDGETWRRHMRINAEAPVMITQALTDLLAAEEGGRVIHFVDIHVMGRPRPGYAAYNASKAALLEMTRSLAVELAPGVTVNAIAPGVVAWAEGMTEAEREAYLERVPLGTAGTSEDAAKAAVYLARDADYVTGQVIRLDGGRWLT
jgi:pteridine reductase